MGEEGLVLGETDSTAYRGDRGKIAYDHSQTTGNPHATTYSDVGADQAGAAAAAYQQAAGYTDLQIANLINGAPQTLDTLKEIADAMAESQDVVDALQAAIGDKADEADFTSHANNSTIHITATERTTWNAKQDLTDDSKNNTVTFTSTDNTSIFNSGNLGGQSAYAWSAVAKISTGEKHSSLLNKVSTMFKNVRTIAKLIGTTDISSIGDGTLSGGISALNASLDDVHSILETTADRGTQVVLDNNNPDYDCPTDGYVRAISGLSGGTTVNIKTSGNKVMCVLSQFGNGIYQNVAGCYVKKGMKLHVTNAAADQGSVIFQPFDYS